MRRLLIVLLGLLLLAGMSLLIPDVRDRAIAVVRPIVRPEPPPPITPLALGQPVLIATREPLATAPTIAPTTEPEATLVPQTPAELPTAEPTAEPTPVPPTPTPGPVEVNGRLYDAYIPAANKEGQRFQYTCEFDAVWVVLQTYGIDATVDDIIARSSLDTRIEPYVEQTAAGFVIYGGDITTSFSGDYTSNYLARSTGAAMVPVFEQYGLNARPVNDRAGIEDALRSGALVWMKTTVDFQPWRPATWVMPDGRTHQTVLGNDHAVVVMGFNAESVVIRDVLGPTSTNWQRPYEYEVAWETFLAAWGAQSFDALAVPPPGQE